MSGSITDSPSDDADLLAAEYVLGTLEPSDHASLAREAESDAELRAAIDAWERRLAPLNFVTAPVAPPAALWPRIEASAWAGPASAALPPASASRLPGTGARVPSPGARGLRVWQGAAAAGFALAAAFAGIAVLRAPAPAPSNIVTALVPLGQQSPVFLAEATADGGLTVRTIGSLHIAPDRDLELWLLKDGEKVPTPLGLLPQGGVRLAAGSVPSRGGAKILISLEPRGGSPTGLPTGPVLFGGAI